MNSGYFRKVDKESGNHVWYFIPETLVDKFYELKGKDFTKIFKTYKIKGDPSFYRCIMFEDGQ